MSKLVFAVIAFILWLLLTWSLEYPRLLIGAAVAVITTLVYGAIFTQEPKKFANPLRYLRFIYYVPIFFYHCIKANFDVMYRIIHPDMPIKPGIVKIKMSLKTDIAKTFLANSITLTPGTMSVDMDEEHIYVHWIWVETSELKEATELISEKFEKHLKGVFE